MVTKAEVQKVDDFLRDFYAVCQNHKVVFDDAINFLVDSIPVYSPDGFGRTRMRISMEIGPMADSEWGVFLPMEPPITTNGVFNSAGVDNPLP